MKKILAFAGSNSSTSINLTLVRCAAKLVSNCEVTVIDLRDYAAPLFSIDIENESGAPETMRTLNEMFKEYDGFILSSPEYNSAITPVLKNTIDWISRIERPVFKDKPMLLMSAAPGGRGGKSVLEFLEKLLPRWGAQVQGVFSLAHYNDNMDAAALVLTDAEKQAALVAAVQALEKAVAEQEAQGA